MSDISEWSTKEAENTHLDELTLSGEGGQYINKLMCAVKAKEDEQDAKLATVAGGLVFRGTKATYADLEAVEDPAVGDMYSVTALGGENYAWNGTAWDSLGTSDANVVHKTGTEIIDGKKTFTGEHIVISPNSTFYFPTNSRGPVGDDGITIVGGTTYYKGGRIRLYGSENSDSPGTFILVACTSNSSSDQKWLIGRKDGTLTWDGQDIQISSDERIKTALDIVSDDVLDAWGDVQWGQFRYLEAVQEKGEAARLHLGLIAQQIKTAFEERGLNACRYGVLCHEEHEATKDLPAVDLWMVRYAEAQAMEAAYQRRRADRLEKRIVALEARLNGND